MSLTYLLLRRNKSTFVFQCVAASLLPPTGGMLNVGVVLNTAAILGISGSPHGVCFSSATGPPLLSEKRKRLAAAKVSGVCMFLVEARYNRIDCVFAGVLYIGCVCCGSVLVDRY